MSSRSSIASIILILIVFSAGACSQNEGAPVASGDIFGIETFSAPASIDVQQDLEIGTTSSIYSFQYLADIAIDSKGAIYVVDAATSDVQVFSREGELLTRIGARGNGPGEFQQISEVEVTSHDSLYIYDGSLYRISVFRITDNPPGAELQRVLTVPTLPDGRTAQRLWVFDSGDFLVGYSEGYSASDLNEDKTLSVWSFTNTGELRGELFSMPAGDMLVQDRGNGGFRVSTMPFGREPVIRVFGDHIYAGRNDSLRINVLNREGALVTTLRHRYNAPAVVSEEEFQNRLQLYRIDFEELEPELQESIPRTWPVFETFVIDDQERIWVGINTSDHFHGSLWWVFDRNGSELASVRSSDHIHIKAVTGGYLYGDKVNHSGAQTLARYRIGDQLDSLSNSIAVR
jgi:hypothetical protein